MLSLIALVDMIKPILGSKYLLENLDEVIELDEIDYKKKEWDEIANHSFIVGLDKFDSKEILILEI
jgi:hypothetical protein